MRTQALLALCTLTGIQFPGNNNPGDAGRFARTAVGWVVAPHFFVLCVWNGRVAAIKCTQAQPGHVEDRRKALLNARTYVAPYQGLDVADQEKQDGEPPMRT